MSEPPRSGAEPPSRSTAPASGWSAPARSRTSALPSFGSPTEPGLSPQLADASPGLVRVAFQATATAGIGANVPLVVARVETDRARAR